MFFLKKSKTEHLEITGGAGGKEKTDIGTFTVKFCGQTLTLSARLLIPLLRENVFEIDKKTAGEIKKNSGYLRHPTVDEYVLLGELDKIIEAN
jgi:hypothetical protein